MQYVSGPQGNQIPFLIFMLLYTIENIHSACPPNTLNERNLRLSQTTLDKIKRALYLFLILSPYYEQINATITLTLKVALFSAHTYTEIRCEIFMNAPAL